MIDVIVIGGGPAGLMAALVAARNGAGVVLLEKMRRPGRKLLLTGGGRCNLSNDRDPGRFVEDCGPRSVLGIEPVARSWMRPSDKARGPRNGGGVVLSYVDAISGCSNTARRDAAQTAVGGYSQHAPRTSFLRNALERFGTGATVAFFEEIGLRLAMEPGGRWYPASGRSADVLGVLATAIRRAGVRVMCNAGVRGIAPSGEGFDVETDAGTFDGRAVVLATGGASYPATGSTGDGYAMAAALGHAVKTPRPALVPMLAKPAWVADLKGLSLDDTVLRFSQGYRAGMARGALLFTHFGVSGPAVLDASRGIAEWFDLGPVRLEIDLAPDSSDRDLDTMLMARAEARGNRLVGSLLEGMVPVRLAGVLLEAAGIRSDLRAARLSGGGRKALVKSLKGLRLELTGTRGFAEAIVTRGGVDSREVDPATMESRLAPGLFFAGEVLDVDGPCGGYNLQIAWTTGWVAGRSAAFLVHERRQSP